MDIGPDSSEPHTDSPPPDGQRGTQFSIRSIMVITLLIAVASTAAGQLWQAVQGNVQDVGPFILITCMAPLGVTTAVYWLSRLLFEK